MRCAVQTAEVVCNSVNITYISVSESTTCIIRALEHILSCFKILTVVVSFFKIFMNKLCSNLRLSDSVLCVAVADICLNSMSHCIHTCCRSDVWWQTYGKFRVKHSILRTKTSIVDGIFLMSFGIGYNSSNCCF